MRDRVGVVRGRVGYGSEGFTGGGMGQGCIDQGILYYS